MTFCFSYVRIQETGIFRRSDGFFCCRKGVSYVSFMEFKDNRMLCDTVICDETDDTRTHKIFHALDEICYEFDLSKPLWLDSTIAEFKRHAKARFYQDNFVDEIDFDYLEIQIIEE